MNDKRLLSMNIIMAIVLAAVIFFIIKPFGFASKKTEVRAVTAKPVKPAPEKAEGAGYDIDKVRPKPQGQTGEIESSGDVYANYPVADVGDDMSKGWAGVDPADKAKFMDGLDKEIVKQEEVVKNNPEDKRARNLLKISRMMKRAALNNFNFDAKTKEILKKN